jgi:cation diffusion facilitator family transporter
LAGIVGIISNFLLCTVKIIIGIISGSIAIIADGINNLTDASSSIITLIGFKLAAMPEDKDHPYGHARIEYLAGLFISVIIIVVGIFLLYSSVGKIIEPQSLEFSYTAILILAGAVLVKFWQMRFYIYAGKQINSIALLASGTDSRNDALTTTTILAGVLITQFTGLQLDGYLGCAVAAFILWSGVQLIMQTSSPLLGEAPDEELVKAIAKMTCSHEGVLGIHDLVVHNYGPGKIFASIHIEVDSNGDLMDSHDMIDNIEKEISEKLGIHFVAHMDPVRVHDPLIADLKAIVERTIEPIEGVQSAHDLRVVIGPTHTNVIFDLVINEDCCLKEPEIKEIFEKEIQKVNPSFRIVISFDRAYTEV